MKSENHPGGRKLRLVSAARTREQRLAGVALEVVPCENLPAAAEALVVEEDRYFVLGADPGFRATEEHPLKIWTELHELRPASPGSVVVAEGAPLQFRAVIHDLSANPTWRVEWVAQALQEIVRLSELYAVRNLALPPLGAVHGRLSPERFLELLREALERDRAAGLERIWILAPARHLQKLEQLLEE